MFYWKNPPLTSLCWFCPRRCRWWCRLVLRYVFSIFCRRFLCATGHVAINLCRLVQGYIQPPTKAAMIAFLFNITVKTNVAKQYLLVMVVSYTLCPFCWSIKICIESVFRPPSCTSNFFVGAYSCSVMLFWSQIWRVYMVWEKSWKISAIPSVLCAGAFSEIILVLPLCRL